MLLLPAVALVLAAQNPNSPWVQLPPDWKMENFEEGRHSLAKMIGPRAEAIRFPLYGLGVESANELRKRDAKATYVVTFLAGRPIEAALAGDGTLVVSVGRREPYQHASDLPMNYRMRPRSARETALLLGIVLTRLDAYERDPESLRQPKRVPDAPGPHGLVFGDPFKREVDLPEGYAYREGGEDGFTLGRFESPKEPPISFRTVTSTSRGSDPVPIPGKEGWEERAIVLKRRLSVQSVEGGGLSAWFDPPYERSDIHSVGLFAAKAATPQTALIAIFAALNCRPI